MMDTNKDIETYKKQWFNQVEQDSKNLFEIAEDAIKKKPDLKVIIVKRLPRSDRSSQDIIGIKQKLSEFANSVYDQLWIKSCSPANINIIQLQLNEGKSTYLNNLIYGNKSDEKVDGLHLRGPGGSRHFTYRAVQCVKPVLLGTTQRTTSHTLGGSDKVKHAKNGGPNNRGNTSTKLGQSQIQNEHANYQQGKQRGAERKKNLG